MARKVLSVGGWTTAVTLVGLLTGVAVVILPPLPVMGVIALFGVLLFWAIPELQTVPTGLLRKIVFATVIVQLSVPTYYAIETNFLPWISIRRIFALALIVLFAITVAGSNEARKKIVDSLGANPALAFCVIGFFVMMFLSIITSTHPFASLKDLSDALLSWYIPLFAAILIVRDEDDVVLLFRLIAIAAIVDSFAALIEFFLQRRYYFDIFPQSLLSSMLASNPLIAGIYYGSNFRNGLYRASSIYITSLAFGEFGAMCAPISAYFILHARNWKDRALGVVTAIGVLLCLYCSGARGAYMGVLVSVPTMLCLWVFRYSRVKPHNLASPIIASLTLVGCVVVTLAILFWPRLHSMVIGGAAELESTQDRFTQWAMAMPRIAENPVTGHGQGMGAEVVGFLQANGIPTLDSYIISLLVEVGVPGFLLFCGMIGYAVWTGLRLYLKDTDDRAAIGGAIACSLLAFAVYRFALSQRENHTLLFLLLALTFVVSRLQRDRLAGHKPLEMQAADKQ